jgi:hypothetical protein
VRAAQEHEGTSPLACQRTPMPAPYPEAMRKHLALWVASGGKLTDWCRENAVCLKTGCNWSKADAFKKAVAAHRRRAADRAVRRIARHLSRAVRKIDRLIEKSRDDDATLAAAISLVSGFLDDQGYDELKAELRQLSQRIDAMG